MPTEAETIRSKLSDMTDCGQSLPDALALVRLLEIAMTANGPYHVSKEDLQPIVRMIHGHVEDALEEVRSMAADPVQ